VDATATEPFTVPAGAFAEETAESPALTPIPGAKTGKGTNPRQSEPPPRPERTEPHIESRLVLARDAAIDPTDAIAQAAVDTASDLGAAAIVSATVAGYAPLRIARYRPPTPVLAVTPDPRVRQRLALVWGVLPWGVPRARSAEEMLQLALAAVREAGVARSGDSIVLTGSIPFDARGRTNFLKVHVLE